MAVLDPDVVRRADFGAGPALAPREIRGAEAVAKSASTFMQRQGRTSSPGPRWSTEPSAGSSSATDGCVLVMGFTVSDGKIVAIDILADPGRLRDLDLAFLD